MPQELSSPVADIGTPLACGGVCDKVLVEDIEEEELVRCALLRGMNIRDTSSAFIELSPPVLTLAPHAALLFGWRLGGLATAVICKPVCNSVALI